MRPGDRIVEQEKRDECLKALENLRHVSFRMLELAQGFSEEEEWFQQFDVLLAERQQLLTKLAEEKEVLSGDLSPEMEGLLREIEKTGTEIFHHLSRHRDELQKRLLELNRTKKGVQAYAMPELDKGAWFIDRKK